MERGHVELEVCPDGVAVITICNPPVNSLAIPVFWGLKEKYEEALKRDDVKAIVITGAGDKFSGGFDIISMEAIQKNGDLSQISWVSVDLKTILIEGARKPSVAAIQGLALGGGLELAMCCHARVAAPKAQLGLPELQLGVIPGGGGTQRLPRLVGLSKAIEMMLTSKPVSSEEAKELGLVDAIVPAKELLPAARQWALAIASFQKPWTITLHKTDQLEPLGEAREILKFAREQTMIRAPNLSHPLKCLDAVEEGIVSGGLAGLYKEGEVFKECVFSDTAKSLVHVFFAQRATAKVKGITDRGLKPRSARKVGVVGGGLMGSGIATACILNGIQVAIKEVNADFLQAGIDRVKANLQSRVKKGKMSEEKFKKTLALLKGTLDYNDFKDADIVIEAVIEKLPLKQQIFSDLEKICPPTCVLASNTSTIDLNLIGEKITARDRVAGAHFFSPAHVMPLFEIIRTSNTAPQVLIDLLDFGKKIKKVPVVVGNCPGFAVNRTFFPYTQASLLLVDLGLDVYRIDRIVAGFGMPMGPFRLADLVGFEVGLASGMTYLEVYPDRVYKSMLFPLLMEDKRLGEKTRKGFYVYDDRRKAKPDPEVRKYLDKSRSLSGVMPNNKPIVLSDEEVIEVIFFPVVNEACRVLEEGVVSKASDLDVASVMGMGFPPYRGGIVFWADLIGAKRIATRLNQLSKAYGDFFKPCTWLEHCAATGQPLRSPVESSKVKSRL
ncbi:hypothetical protein GOP47_0025527 [Adiantum capillus-veneris]|uniref:3-hydroxyacyl-CoA dehydrogenase n=1 Tax=Adiantum capillus-veneris TaxID=13818 RepID=A0A9D4U1G5_ADICA|nr:hypothetical protein GOP47_0025527 [Adiantum capillus-veneris]